MYAPNIQQISGIGSMPSKNEENEKYNSRTADKFVLRLPEGMRAKIAEVARINHRSMNGEILSRIDDSMELEQKYEETRELNRYMKMRIDVLEAAAEEHKKLAAKS